MIVVKWLIAIVIAFFVGKLVSKLRLPSILGWLITGIVVGPDERERIHFRMGNKSDC